MARRLGEQFYHVAMGPIAMAGHCLRRGDVMQGLAELSGESLVGSVQRAVDAVAATVGLPATEVERLLPAADMDALVDKIAAIQTDAVAQWERHMAVAGGLLEAIAKLTADGRPPDAGLCLMRIATKMKLEKALAAPLRELSSLVEDWQHMLERVRERIEQGKELEQARLLRRRKRLALVAGGALAVLVATGAAVVVTRARGHVAAILARSNPCEIELLEDRDRALASTEQQRAVEGKRGACRTMREEARLAEERAAAEEAERQRLAERRRRREALCEELGERLASPSKEPLPAKFDEVIGKEGDLFGRLARGGVTATDVVRDVQALPCLDAPSGDALAGAYAASLVRSANDWVQKAVPSASAHALVARGKGAVDPRALRTLVERTEEEALTALTDGHAAPMETALKRCALLTTLGLEHRRFCAMVSDRLRK